MTPPIGWGGKPLAIGFSLAGARYGAWLAHLQDVFAPLFFKDLFSAIRALLRRRSKDEINDGATYGGHGLGEAEARWFFFSAPRRE